MAQGLPPPEADGTTALHRAVYGGDVDEARRLIAAGADAVVFTATSVDPYNPKAVRASAYSRRSSGGTSCSS